MGAQWRIINQNYKNLEGKWEGRATILHIHTLLGAGAGSSRPAWESVEEKVAERKIAKEATVTSGR